MNCIECQMEGFHKMDCGSKALMLDYEKFILNISQLPEPLLRALITRCCIELNERKEVEWMNKAREDMSSVLGLGTENQDDVRIEAENNKKTRRRFNFL